MRKYPVHATTYWAKFINRRIFYAHSKKPKIQILTKLHLEPANKDNLTNKRKAEYNNKIQSKYKNKISIDTSKLLSRFEIGIVVILLETVSLEITKNHRSRKCSRIESSLQLKLVANDRNFQTNSIQLDIQCFLMNVGIFSIFPEAKQGNKLSYLLGKYLLLFNKEAAPSKVWRV